MTDPRAALAEIADNGIIHKSVGQFERMLAERGVLLVTEERLAAGMHYADSRVPCMYRHEPFADCFMRSTHERIAAAIFAALSGEATE